MQSLAKVGIGSKRPENVGRELATASKEVCLNSVPQINSLALAGLKLYLLFVSDSLLKTFVISHLYFRQFIK